MDWSLRLITIVFFCMLSQPFCTIAGDSIKIGAIFSKTGEAKVTSIEHLVATRIAIEEINTKGGVLGKQLELLEFDNKSTGLGSRDAAQRAVSSGVRAVLGPSWSSHALATAPVLQKSGIPMITPLATNPKVTEIGNYIFRTCFTDAFQATILANFLHEEVKAQRVLVLINTGYIYSMDLAKMVIEAFESYGEKTVRTENYSENLTDYHQLLRNVSTLEYDAVFIPGYTRDSAQLIKTAVELGIQSTFVGGDGWSHELFDYGGDAINGTFYITHWSISLPGENNKAFVMKMNERYPDKAINAGMALAYDSAYILADAITRAQSDDPAKIREALSRTKDFLGLTGKISFDTTGNPVKQGVINRLENGSSSVFKVITP